MHRYSPERINSGDKARTQRTIVKIVSGDTPDTLATLSAVYGSVVDAGIFEASSTRVAKAAKVIKNSQRDVNIALMNELAIIFDKMGLNKTEVLEAAGAKWNFLKFKRAWWAATASASIRITSPVRQKSSATIRR